ncbi:polyprenyl synthetase family protein [Acetobacteraceae bacterium KSS8]|uniref:Polyprenyl synthetase family protein n=1 Tax=Endosaccharibacter trunci TaxID=2812733 RepID=A0ABT1W5G5_9PROT|nr:polyprenyl synthetase family protein [Acetobacteraceae bacterium KSS8]
MSDESAPIDRILARALEAATGLDAPPGLAAALRHAVFPGGARIRPRLSLAVAEACGMPHPALSGAVAAAIEFVHCASLVHDDLPCFDDSALRRGRPSVHVQFGAPLAVLAGDALIVQGFDTLARGCGEAPHLLPKLVSLLAGCSGMPYGIAGGQGWECEPRVDPVAYARAKTGALFAAATMGGAASAGEAPEPWRVFGEQLGLAYQLADDLADLLSDPTAIGKPVGRDRVLGRPNTAHLLGQDSACARLETLVADAVAAIPACRNREQLRSLVAAEVRRLLPPDLSRAA